MSETAIDYGPSEGLSYDPSQPKYWDERLLGMEVTRAFEICSSCRLCFKYCDSFPDLFRLVDAREGDVRKVDAAGTERVMDQCFQCKLCEVQCPYTPRDGHAFQLDFPRLVHRYKAVRAKKRGAKLRDRVLGDPETAGKMARASFGAANALNRVGAHRWLMEKVLGVHRDKLLPEFAPKTFESLAGERGKIAAEPGGEVVLFPTCYVDNNEPQVGLDALFVLEKNLVDARCAKGLRCCGMPAWEHGDLDGLRARAAANLDVLMPYVERGAKVLPINPTCSMMMRREWPELLEGRDRERASRLSAAVQDPCEYLWSLRSQARFATDVKSKPEGGIAYHVPCHLRAQAVGFKARELFKKLFGASVSPALECCGHDGTYAMSVEGFEPSARIGARAFEEMRAADASTWSTDCPLAALQFAQHAGRKPLHPLSILAMAYRGDPFPAPQSQGGAR